MFCAKVLLKREVNLPEGSNKRLLLLSSSSLILYRKLCLINYNNLQSIYIYSASSILLTMCTTYKLTRLLFHLVTHQYGPNVLDSEDYQVPLVTAYASQYLFRHNVDSLFQNRGAADYVETYEKR